MGGKGESVRGDSLRDVVTGILDELVTQQEAKLMAVAQRIDARLTADDVLQPHDFPALARDPTFNYEDGILAGLKSAAAAMRAALSGSGG